MDPCPYEQERQARIERNNRFFKEAGIPGIVSKLQVLQAPKPRGPRLAKVKGVAPVRRSARSVKTIHKNLSEDALGVGSAAACLSFDFPSRRFGLRPCPREKVSPTSLIPASSLLEIIFLSSLSGGMSTSTASQR